MNSWESGLFVQNPARWPWKGQKRSRKGQHHNGLCAFSWACERSRSPLRWTQWQSCAKFYIGKHDDCRGTPNLEPSSRLCPSIPIASDDSESFTELRRKLRHGERKRGIASNHSSIEGGGDHFARGGDHFARSIAWSIAASAAIDSGPAGRITQDSWPFDESCPIKPTDILCFALLCGEWLIHDNSWSLVI